MTGGNSPGLSRDYPIRNSYYRYWRANSLSITVSHFSSERKRLFKIIQRFRWLSRKLMDPAEDIKYVCFQPGIDNCPGQR